MRHDLFGGVFALIRLLFTMWFDMRNIFTLLLFLVSLSAYAQQATQYSMYMLNPFAFNPAYAGYDNSLSLTGVYRSQWVGLEGAPETRALSAHSPLYIIGGGVGIHLESENIGSWKQTSVYGAYAYALPTSTGSLSIGLSAGFVQRELDGASVRTPGTILDDEGNPIDHQDPLLSTGLHSGAGLSFNAGLYYRNGNFDAGLSVLNLSETTIDMGDIQFKPDRSFFAYLKYRLKLSDDFHLEPSVVVKSTGEQTQTDFSGLIRFRENIFAGVSYRGYNSETQDAIVILTGIKLSEKLSLGYAYDLTQSSLNSVSNGTHEILLNYNLNKPIGQGRPPVIIYNPRSL